MTRESVNDYLDGHLQNGYDYDHQSWVQDGEYVDCSHPEEMNCRCYGRLHKGMQTRFDYLRT